MKTMLKIFGLICAAAAAVLGLALLKEENSSQYIPIYDTDDDLY